MQRRQFLTAGLSTALTLAGLGAATLSPRAARAQRTGIAPIALAATSGARRRVLRVYAGRNDRQFILFLRADGRERWFRLNVPPGLEAALRTALADGGMTLEFAQGTARTETQVALRRQGAHLHFRATGGPGAIDGAATAPAETGPTTRLGFQAAIVAIVAILAVVAIIAMLTDTPLSIRLRCRGMGCSLEMDVGATPEPAPGPGPDGFMSNPECDLFPPLLC